jgi:ribosomal protein S18 acetylase RimI-like enzyme
LTFAGVVPDRRGRGFGRALVAAACELAPTLFLIVDVRNRPAVQLYRSAGFGIVGSREVFLWFPGPPAGTTDPKVIGS